MDIIFNGIDLNTLYKKENVRMSKSPSQKQVEEAKKVLEKHEKREKELSYVRDELSFTIRLFKQVKFKVDKADRTITFAGVTESGDLKLGVSKCDVNDIFDTNIGKLIAVRRSLNKEIDDIVKLVENKYANGGVIYADAIHGADLTYNVNFADLRRLS